MLSASATSAATRAMLDAVGTSPGTPVVFDTVRAKGPEGIQFDVWYCNRHLVALANQFPIGRLRRYAAPSRASYLAIGELDRLPGSTHADPGASAAPAMVESIERFVGRPLGTMRRQDVGEDIVDAAIAYPVFSRVPAEREAEINRWYDEEHLPILLGCPQWAMTRRFRVEAAHGLDWTHVALHYLTDPRALESPQRDVARSTPWRSRLTAEGAFTAEYRVFYRVQDF